MGKSLASWSFLIFKGLVQYLANIPNRFIGYTPGTGKIPRLYLHFLFSIVGIMVLFSLGTALLIQKNLTLGISDLLMASLLTANIFHARRYKKFNFNIHLGVSLVGIFFIYIFLTGGVNNNAFVWYYIFPLLASFLLGSKRGAIATILILLPVIGLFLFKIPPPFFSSYTFDFKVRFISSFLVVFAFSYLFEYSRERNRKALRRANDELEKRVEERTLALQEAIQSLQKGISERRRMEETLRESEEKYRTILEEMEEGYFETDLVGNLTFINDAGCRHLRYPRQELIGMNNRVYADEENAKKMFQAFNKAYKTGEPCRVFDYEITRKDGTKAIIELSASLIRDPEGKPIGFRGVSRDITERKRAEEALRRSEEKYRTILETIEESYFEVDIAGNFTFFNDSLCRLLGYSRDEMMGMNNRQYTDNENAQKLYQTFNRVYRTGKPTKEFDWEIIRKEGIKRSIEASVSLIKDSSGQPIGFRGIVRDITERKRAEEEMAALQEQFRQSQKIEAIGRLAGGIAHDFNNLLTVIKGYSQLSLVEIKEGDPLRGNIEEIKRASDKAADLTRQLLAFSRRQILEMKVLDLNTVLRDMDKMLHRLIGEDIELVTVFTDDLGRVKTDPGWVEQIIMNLAVNARDAMPSVGKLTIETANVELDGAYARNHIAVTPGRYVMLSVSDTGVGMTPEVRQQVFEPFFTTKEKGKGTGLGLSTVYGIVKQSGGNIWVYSEPGKGTTFKIYLPRVDEPLEELKEKVVKEELPHGSETILLVEDEEVVRKLAVRILKRQGYTVLEGSHGNEAIDVCKQHKGPVHLLLTDVVMPQMSGRQLAEQLKQVCQDFKVLYMSGYTDNAITHHGVLEEGINYLQKPFTVDGLARKVREVLDK